MVSIRSTSRPLRRRRLSSDVSCPLLPGPDDRMGRVTDERIVGTPHGEARIVAHRARRPVATLALGHGAGAGIESGDLAALAARLPKQDINVFLIEQPWRRAGKKLAPAPEVPDEAWIAIIGQLRVRTPLVIGGRSAGARVACRTASSLGASGVL